MSDVLVVLTGVVLVAASFCAGRATAWGRLADENLRIAAEWRSIGDGWDELRRERESRWAAALGAKRSGGNP